MLVSCPSCDASYQLSAEALGEGRRLRCARCKTDWFAEATPAPIHGLEDVAAIDMIDVEATPAGEAPSSDPKRRFGIFRKRSLDSSAKPARAPRKRRSSFSIRQRLPAFRPAALFATVCALGLVAMFVEREAIVRAAPSLASLYALAGLDVNVRGLAIRDVRSVEQIDEGVPLLLVTGSIANVTQASIDVPRLRLAVTSGDERELYAWTTVAARTKLAPGEEATFRARLASPPADGRQVAVRFLARQDLAAHASR